MLDTVGLCYLAALLMRLPICVSDFYQYVSATYVFLGVLDIVPPCSMKDVLTKIYNLQPDHTPGYSLYPSGQMCTPRHAR